MVSEHSHIKMSRLMSYFLFSIRKQRNINNLVSASVTNKTQIPRPGVLTVATAEAREWRRETAEEGERGEDWTPGPNPGTGH